MASYIALALALYCIPAVVVNAWPCPTFSCDPTSPSAGFIWDTAVGSSSYSQDPDRNVNLAKCASYCSTVPKALYWAYDTKCDSTCPAHVTIWGNCNCYGASACVNSKFYGTSTPASLSGRVVGKVCGGGVQGDPHFTGGFDSHFDFTGELNTSFCMLTDSHVQVNMLLDGYRGQYGLRQDKPMTWIRKLALLWGHHTLVFSARPGPESEYLNGYMQSMEADGEAFTLDGDSKLLFNDAVEIKWTGKKVPSGDDLVDEYLVQIGHTLSILLTLRPEVANLRTASDGLVHFAVKFLRADLSSNVHGVLGQTHRPDHAKKLQQQQLVYSDVLHRYVVPGDNAEGFLDGKVQDYVTSDILSPDCKVSRFARSTSVDHETSLALELSGTTAGGYSSRK